MQGAGALKHVDIRDMWIRESIAVGDSRLRNIPRERNVADMLTHVVASSAFVRAGGAHGLRLEVGLRPGSWEDRWPRGVLEHNHMYSMIHTSPCSPPQCHACRTAGPSQRLLFDCAIFISACSICRCLHIRRGIHICTCITNLTGRLRWHGPDDARNDWCHRAPPKLMSSSVLQVGHFCSLFSAAAGELPRYFESQSVCGLPARRNTGAGTSCGGCCFPKLPGYHCTPTPCVHSLRLSCLLLHGLEALQDLLGVVWWLAHVRQHSMCSLVSHVFAQSVLGFRIVASCALDAPVLSCTSPSAIGGRPAILLRLPSDQRLAGGVAS